MSMGIAIGVGVLITICLLIIFLVPDEKAIAKKKQEEKNERRRQRREEQKQPTKDWEKVAERYQTQLHHVKNTLGSTEKKVRELEKQLLAEEIKTNKLKEKLSKEKEWIAKKEKDVGNKEHGMAQIKQELQKIQNLYSEEHVINIRHQKEIEELKKDYDLNMEQRRIAESECAQLKAKNDNHRQEIAHLKKDVAELTKKQDAETFVSRAQYDKVEKELKEAKNEIDRISRQRDAAN